MILGRKVFIIGAGAHVAYGFPTGKGLKDEIIGPQAIAEYASSVFHNHIEFVERFKKAESLDSIDAFLQNHPEFEEIGKYAIAWAISRAEADTGGERKASAYKKNIEDQEIDDDWIRFLTRLTTNTLPGDHYKKIGKNDVNFITFNYDRTLEHFIYEDLTNAYRCDPDGLRIIGEFITSKIHHVYGKIGPLPWQSANGFPYGVPTKKLPKLHEIMHNINIIRTGDEPRHELVQLLERADTIFFLGFGFATENLKVLNIPECIPRDCRVFGTGCGLYLGERTRIEKMIDRRSHHNALQSSQIYDDKTSCLAALREVMGFE